MAFSLNKQFFENLIAHRYENLRLQDIEHGTLKALKSVFEGNKGGRKERRPILLEGLRRMGLFYLWKEEQV